VLHTFSARALFFATYCRACKIADSHQFGSNTLSVAVSLCEMSPQQGTFIKNQKGGENLWDESNFTYRMHRSNKEKTKSWYKCVKIDTLHCPAVAVWNDTTSLIDEVLSEHNLSTDLLGDLARTHESRMVESAVAVGASGGIAIGRKVKDEPGEGWCA
jgi:hypothetical protein